MFGFFKDAFNYEQRCVGRTEVNGLEVSTAYTSDEGYETALLDANGAHPVERYETKSLAEKGHDKWCKKAKTIKSVVKLGWLGLVDDKKIKLIRKVKVKPTTKSQKLLPNKPNL